MALKILFSILLLQTPACDQTPVPLPLAIGLLFGAPLASVLRNKVKSAIRICVCSTDCSNSRLLLCVLRPKINVISPFASIILQGIKRGQSLVLWITAH